MPFRDELQAAYDKIAALELKLRERTETLNTNHKQAEDAKQDKAEEEKERAKEILQANIARFKAQDELIQQLKTDLERIKEWAGSDLEALATLSRPAALLFFQSQLSAVRQEIQSGKAALTKPIELNPQQGVHDAQFLKEKNQFLREKNQKLRMMIIQAVGFFAEREKKLSDLCTLLSQPPKE